MSRIKHTKTELKAQNDALRRFLRFLPMLQLKKQQLQMEIQSITGAIALQEGEEAQVRADLQQWVKLIGDDGEVGHVVRLRTVLFDEGNIAGVAIPVLREALIERRDYDLWATPPWLDEAAAAVESLIRIRVARETLEEQRRRILEELRVTSQRVNLFEKVKIPECRENIRVIKIFLGDEQTAAVARGKIAKRRATSEQQAA
jgi:V/A-type H+-transporting ATPase subunit D